MNCLITVRHLIFHIVFITDDEGAHNPPHKYKDRKQKY